MTGFHAHDQHQRELIQPGEDGLCRSIGLDGHTGLASGSTDGVQGGLNIIYRLHMEGNVVGTGLRKALCKLEGVGDHQMDIINGVGQSLLQRLQYGETEADIVHEMAVHHIVMDHIGTCVQNAAAAFGKAGKIGGKNRGADLSHQLHLLSESFIFQLICLPLLYPTCKVMARKGRGTTLKYFCFRGIVERRKR